VPWFTVQGFVVSTVERSAERLENDEDKPVYYFPEKSTPTANILLLPQENIRALYPTMVVALLLFGRD
jgi:hypothetical protein